MTIQQQYLNISIEVSASLERLEALEARLDALTARAADAFTQKEALAKRQGPRAGAAQGRATAKWLALTARRANLVLQHRAAVAAHARLEVEAKRLRECLATADRAAYERRLAAQQAPSPERRKVLAAQGGRWSTIPVRRGEGPTRVERLASKAEAILGGKVAQCRLIAIAAKLGVPVSFGTKAEVLKASIVQAITSKTALRIVAAGLVVALGADEAGLSALASGSLETTMLASMVFAGNHKAPKKRRNTKGNMKDYADFAALSRDRRKNATAEVKDGLYRPYHALAMAYIKPTKLEVSRPRVRKSGAFFITGKNLQYDLVEVTGKQVFLVGRIDREDVTVVAVFDDLGEIHGDLVVTIAGKRLRVAANANLERALGRRSAECFEALEDDQAKGGYKAVGLTDRGLDWAEAVMAALYERLAYGNQRVTHLEVLTSEEVDAIKANGHPRAASLGVTRVAKWHTATWYKGETEREFKFAIVPVSREGSPRPVLDYLRGMGHEIDVVAESDGVRRIASMSEDVRNAVTAQIDNLLLLEGAEVVGHAKGQWYYAPVGGRKELFEALSANETLEGSFTRNAVILRRTTGAQAPVVNLGAFDAYISEALDGVAAIIEGVKAAQGTVIVRKGEKVYVIKGIVRGPLTRVHKDGTIEREACGIAPVGEHKARVPLDADEVLFYQNNTASLGKARVSLQTLAFNADLPKALKAYSAKVRTMGLDVYGTEAAERIRAGVPMEFLRGLADPFDRALRIERDGVRVWVTASELVPASDGDGVLPVGLTPRVKSAFEGRTGQALRRGVVGGDIFRDPPTPGGTGRFEFAFNDVIYAANGDAFIVVNPASPEWKWLGGDFDGDTGVITAKQFGDAWNEVDPAYVAMLSEAKAALRLGASNAVPTFRDGDGVEVDELGLIQALSSNRSEKIGQPIQLAMRYAFEGRLDEEIDPDLFFKLTQMAEDDHQGAKVLVDLWFHRGLPRTYRVVADVLAQGNIDDAKHPVSEAILKWADRLLMSGLEFEESDTPADLFAAWYDFKKAPYELRKEAWAALLKYAAEAKDLTDEERALFDVLLSVDEAVAEAAVENEGAQARFNSIRGQAEELYRGRMRRHQRELMAAVTAKGAAGRSARLAVLNRIKSQHLRAEKVLTTLAKQHGQAGYLFQLAKNNKSDEALREAKAIYEHVRARLEGVIARGIVDPMHAYGALKPQMVADLLPTRELLALALRAGLPVYLDTNRSDVLADTPTAGGVWTTGELIGEARLRANDAALIEAFGLVKVTVEAGDDVVGVSLA